MNQKVYTIQRGDFTKTVKTTAGALGAVLGLFPELRKGVTWKEEGKLTTVQSGNVTVTAKEIDIPLSWVS